jgi:hypothetical protein
MRSMLCMACLILSGAVFRPARYGRAYLQRVGDIGDVGGFLPDQFHPLTQSSIFSSKSARARRRRRKIKEDRNHLHHRHDLHGLRPIDVRSKPANGSETVPLV